MNTHSLQKVFTVVISSQLRVKLQEQYTNNHHSLSRKSFAAALQVSRSRVSLRERHTKLSLTTLQKVLLWSLRANSVQSPKSSTKLIRLTLQKVFCSGHFELVQSKLSREQSQNYHYPPSPESLLLWPLRTNSE